MTIKDLVTAYRDYLLHERQLRESSVVAYLSDLDGLCAFLGDRPVSEVNAGDLRAYMRFLGRQGYKSTSIRRKFHGFGTFWRWLKLENHASDVITESLNLPRKPQRIVHWLNAHDLRAFVETSPDRADPVEQQRDHTAWLLLAWLGLRRGELLGLEVGDMRLDEDMIIIRDAKGQKDRLLPLPEQIKPELARLVEGRTAGYVFQGRDGKQWKVRAFNRAFARHLRTCGLDGQGITPHTLRHTFATHLVLAGVQIVIVSKLLGHADIQSTMTYVHVGLGSMRAAIGQHVLAKKSTLL